MQDVCVYSNPLIQQQEFSTRYKNKTKITKNFLIYISNFFQIK